ncbi:MAG TPA: hypothetical protein PLY87_10100 [Planctomycetaceae bacterium]|nr:hypothetical protein [Planctomycetaceae bacterium]HQZ65418.1 hypothetical protein [Planctomycetaceae bacterium]
MPADNRFQHQLYPTETAVAPAFRVLEADAGLEADFQRLHTVLKIGRVVVVHGTFVGDDPFGIAEILRAVAESVPLLAGQFNYLAELSLENARPFTLGLTGDIGNYTEAYRVRFQELVGNDPLVELFSPTWSGQNHHLARADLAVRLIHQLLLRPLLPDQNVLLWGHSHAGNAFALLTNLLANHKPTVAKFFEAADQSGQPHWDAVREHLEAAASPHPLAQRVFIAGFGTPVRYGWDTDGYAKLLHVSYHRVYDETSPEITKPLFPPYRIDEILYAKWGDWVQAFAIAGTDVSNVSTRTVNKNLSLILEANLPEPQHGLDTRFIMPKRVRDTCFRWKAGTRCHADGINLLVDYVPSGDVTPLGRPIESSLMGHGASTTLRWLPAQLKLVMEMLIHDTT